MLAVFAPLLCALLALPQERPEVVVTKDDTVITKSCTIRIPEGTVIADKNGDGVIHVKGDDVDIVFADGSWLRGAPTVTAGDTLTGYGIRIEGHRNVKLSGARISGFKCAIHATKADGLEVAGCELRGNFRQRLKSTPQAEDGGDWLYPHHNDDNQWLKNYGASIYIEDSKRVAIYNTRIREGQNGIILDNVDESSVASNDASFLSGWGLALWRSSANRIERNALDFCVRGYSHGVYNRGQDSAGLLMFEQCCKNRVAQNSITHGGDGIFAFAGEESLSKDAALGCNENTFTGNDLSYAAAHGLELTFSFKNLITWNRFAGNAICGIWGGYSQETQIADNVFEDNGEGAYGLERGGVNIEHGFKNWIENNCFARNACGINLWSDDDAELLKKPWAKANHKGSERNAIVNNTFENDAIGIQLRACGITGIQDNAMRGVATEIQADDASRKKIEVPSELVRLSLKRSPESSGPIGKRDHLRGRQNIVMTEWGPWDHESPLLRLAEAKGDVHVWELHQAKEPVAIGALLTPLVAQLGPADERGMRKLEVRALAPGVHAYRVKVEAEGFAGEAAGTILNAKWSARFFKTSKDPREDRPAFERDAKAAPVVTLDKLELKFGHGGPKEAGVALTGKSAEVGRDRFGTSAEAIIPMRKGRWRVVTLSDDGIRVTVDQKPVIDNWTWHGPTRDAGEFSLDRDRAVRILVEHFELDGFATLQFNLERVE